MQGLWPRNFLASRGMRASQDNLKLGESSVGPSDSENGCVCVRLLVVFDRKATHFLGGQSLKDKGKRELLPCWAALKVSQEEHRNPCVWVTYFHTYQTAAQAFPPG